LSATPRGDIVDAVALGPLSPLANRLPASKASGPARLRPAILSRIRGIREMHREGS
jgi:hypothetical protein